MKLSEKDIRTIVSSMEVALGFGNLIDSADVSEALEHFDRYIQETE